MARNSGITVSGGTEVRQWEETFDHLADRMVDHAIPIMQDEVADAFRATQALTHEYPQGATWFGPITKLKRRDVLAAGRLKRSGFHIPAYRVAPGIPSVTTSIEYLAEFSEYERLGTRHSHPPVYGDNIPGVTEHAAPEHAAHDFMRPWWPAMDVIEHRIPEIWEEIWR